MKAKQRKQKTWSGVEWDGFQFGGYSLNGKVLDYRFKDHAADSASELRLYDILQRFRGEPFERADAFNEGLAVYKDKERKSTFSGTPFTAHLLATMLNLQKNGVDPFGARWFYYDKVYCLEDPMTGYKFFLAYKDKIVEEQVRLVDHSGSGFDPHLFGAGNEHPPIWSDELDFDEGFDAYWYKKFYMETKTGQLHMLSDIPRPYKSDAEIATANMAAMFTTVIKQLAWILLLLLVIAVLLWFRR